MGIKHFDTQVGMICSHAIKTAHLSLRLLLLRKKYDLECFCNLLEIKYTDFFYSCTVLFAVNHSLRHCYQLFHITSGSSKIHVLPVFNISVDCFYEKIYWLRKCITPNYQ